MSARALPTCVVPLLVVLPALLLAREASDSGDEWEIREVLGRYVGHWKGAGGFVGPDGETVTTPGESVGRFVLGGKFVERRSIEAGGGTLQIIGFDPGADSFVSWVFRTDRAMFKASGKWHARSSTMAWTGTTSRDFEFAAEETHGKGQLRGRWQISDQRGTVLLRGDSEDRRVSLIPNRSLFDRALRVVPSSEVPALQPLDDFLGPWRESLTVDASGTIIRGAGTYTVSWILGGASQLWRGGRETSYGSEEYVCVFSFDEAEQEYRAWRFSSRGDVVRYVGEREPGANVWSWTTAGPRDGIHQVFTFEGTSPSRVESRIEIWRGPTRVGTLNSTATRDSSPAN